MYIRVFASSFKDTGQRLAGLTLPGSTAQFVLPKKNRNEISQFNLNFFFFIGSASIRATLR